MKHMKHMKHLKIFENFREDKISYKVYDIKYDTTDESSDEDLTQEDLGLPNELLIKIDKYRIDDENEVIDILANEISDETGYLVIDFNFEKIMDVVSEDVEHDSDDLDTDRRIEVVSFGSEYSDETIYYYFSDKEFRSKYNSYDFDKIIDYILDIDEDDISSPMIDRENIKIGLKDILN